MKHSQKWKKIFDRDIMCDCDGAKEKDHATSNGKTIMEHIIEREQSLIYELWFKIEGTMFVLDEGHEKENRAFRKILKLLNEYKMK